MSFAGRAAAGAGLACLRALGEFVPVRWLLAMGWALVPLLYWLGPRLRRDLLDNARHVLGDEFDPKRGRRQAIAVLRSYARFSIELVTAHRRLAGDGRLLEGTLGREHYESARESGRGIVGVTLHMGNHELGPMLITALHSPIAVVYNRDPSDAFERMRSARRRQRDVIEIAIDRSPFFGVEVLAILRRGGMVLTAADIGFEAPGAGEEYPFLGGKARFLDWPARLSLASGAPILPCFVVRPPGEEGYRLELSPPVFPESAADSREIMARLLPVFERYVRTHSEQWLILHRYWRPS